MKGLSCILQDIQKHSWHISLSSHIDTGKCQLRATWLLEITKLLLSCFKEIGFPVCMWERQISLTITHNLWTNYLWERQIKREVSLKLRKMFRPDHEFTEILVGRHIIQDPHRKKHKNEKNFCGNSLQKSWQDSENQHVMVGHPGKSIIWELSPPWSEVARKGLW